MKIYLLALLLLTIPAAYAVEVDPLITPEQILSCKKAVEREDGTPLAIGEITTVSFYWGTETGNHIYTEERAECRLVIDVTLLDDGNYYYVITNSDAAGRESVPTKELLLTVKRVAKPVKPTDEMWE